MSALPLSSVDPLLCVHFVLSQCLEVVGLGFSVLATSPEVNTGAGILDKR
jgi:hypothetical protein